MIDRVQTSVYTGERLRLRFESGAPAVDILVQDDWRQAIDGRSFLSLRTLRPRGRKSLSREVFIPIQEWRIDGREAVFLAVAQEWEIAGSFQMVKQGIEHLDCEIEARYTGKKPTVAAFRIAFRVTDSGIPRWMVPGVFYGLSTSPGPAPGCPQSPADVFSSGERISGCRAFRADRASLPAIFCWTDEIFVGLVTPERFSHGICGVAFQSGRNGTFLMVEFPCQEKRAGSDSSDEEIGDSTPMLVEVVPSGSVRFSFSIVAQQRDMHAYDKVIREIYSRAEDPQRLLSPWMPREQALELAAWGIWRWHYDPESYAFYETSAFDPYFGSGRGQWDRMGTQVAVESAVLSAYSLREYGVRARNPEYAAAGISALDRIAQEALSSSGFFFPDWSPEEGWNCSRSPKPDWIDARASAEATLFLLKALQQGQARRECHPLWEKAVESNLQAAARAMKADGSLGSYCHAETGAAEGWNGASGIMWIPAFLAAWRLSGSADCLKLARKAGDYYSRFVENEYILGSASLPGSSLPMPDRYPRSTDGYSAIIAYMHLFEATSEQKWLSLARRAADWMATFRWTRNTAFPETTILGRYDFRTFGADVASPSDVFLHNYGLICHAELLALWEATGDTYYLQRARDHLLFAHQFIARCDGDFNARRGMVPRCFFHTDWTHPAGSLLQLAHVRAAGLILYADTFTKDFGDIVVDVGSRKIIALESVRIENIDWRRGVQFDVINPHGRDLELSIRFRKSGIAGCFSVGSSRGPEHGRSSVRADERGVIVR